MNGENAIKQVFRIPRNYFRNHLNFLRERQMRLLGLRCLADLLQCLVDWWDVCEAMKAKKGYNNSYFASFIQFLFRGRRDADRRSHFPRIPEIRTSQTEEGTHGTRNSTVSFSYIFTRKWTWFCEILRKNFYLAIISYFISKPPLWTW